MPRVLYLIGTGFCGSTLVSFLLNSHPEIASVGEATGPYRLWTKGDSFPCSCGESLGRCSFWTRAKAEMESRGLPLDLGRFDLRFAPSRREWLDPLLTRSLRSNTLDGLRDGIVACVPSWRRSMRTVAARNVAFAEIALSLTGKQIFADASKDPTRVRHQLRLSAVDASVLHLVRDAPGFVSSFVRHGQGSIEVAIRTWNRMGDHARRLFARLPEDRRLRVRYEDVCTNPSGELNRISEFLGVSRFVREIDFRATEHHIIGNAMRLSSSSEIALDERWRERLTAQQLEQIERCTRQLREEYGYCEAEPVPAAGRASAT